jgi:hypothetical protein
MLWATGNRFKREENEKGRSGLLRDSWASNLLGVFHFFFCFLHLSFFLSIFVSYTLFFSVCIV